MAKVIICIHGRSNKPKKSTLKRWWKKSINEGLAFSASTFSASKELPCLGFEMSYYADIYYPQPVKNKDNKEAYKKAKKNALKFYNKGIFDDLRKIAGNWLDNPMDWLEEHSHLFSSFARGISKQLLKDLGQYYSKPQVHARINARLEQLLVTYQGHEIILISHSMGTIIAYEVLRQLGKSKQYPNFTVEHFITMGSPLGLSAVKGNIIGSHKKMRTPSCVKSSWVNFSDVQDYVCLDAHLADDYAANSSAIQVNDILVKNDYPHNPHKSYGYLRTPEFSHYLSKLL